MTKQEYTKIPAIDSLEYDLWICNKVISAQNMQVRGLTIALETQSQTVRELVEENKRLILMLKEAGIVR